MIRVFACSHAGDTFAKCGDLVMRQSEWAAFAAALMRSGYEEVSAAGDGMRTTILMGDSLRGGRE